LAALDALGDTVLLSGLALVDVVIVLTRGGSGLSKDGGGGKSKRGDECKSGRFMMTLL
jgi:hypothetical protein